MLQWKIFRAKWFAITWFVFMNILFFLPGSALPEESWFDKVHLDKWVHVCIFASLIFLWRSAFEWKHSLWLFLAIVVLYGLLVEVIQGLWIANRSFDLFDLLADTIGAVIGLYIWSRVYKKNKPL